MCGAVGSRGRRMRRQGMRCEGYCDALVSAPWTALSPAPGDGHVHEAHARGAQVTDFEEGGNEFWRVRGRVFCTTRPRILEGEAMEIGR